MAGMVPIKLLDNANLRYLRSDLGDLGPLRANIKKVGQQAPVITDINYQVLDGARRIEALRQLGHTEVYLVATSDREYLLKLFKEAAERNARTNLYKPMSIVEMMDLRRAMVNFTLASRRPGKIVTVSARELTGVLLSMSDHTMNQLNTLARKREQAFMAGDLDRVKLIEDLAREAYDAGEPIIRANRRLEQIDNPIISIPARDQYKTVDRAITVMLGALQAIENPGTNPIEMSMEEYTNLMRRLTRATTIVARLRRGLKNYEEKNNGN